MIQLFLVLAFIFGFIVGWKICENVVASGLAFLATKENSGVTINEETNKITIDSNVLKNFDLNKEKY